MIVASLTLVALLAAPADITPVAANAAVAMFPSVDPDQTRPVPIDRSRLKYPEGLNLKAAMTGDCFQYFTCLPMSGPPEEQDCTYNGDPRNGCTIDFGICNFCQICCENCFC